MICGPRRSEDSSALTISSSSARASIRPRHWRKIFPRARSTMIGELELGWRSCDIPVIAITGTNGKTTTTELLAQMLNACGQRTIACGNIGKPLSRSRRAKNVTIDVLTVEVSSFQLETIRTFRPAISVWLNFAPDHLDRYRSVAEYRAAKLRIFENQTAEDVAVLTRLRKSRDSPRARVTFSAYTDQADFRLSGARSFTMDKPVLRLSDTKLRGSHNIENLMATLAVGLARGLSFEQMVPPLCSYRAAPAPLRICARSRRRRVTSTIQRRQTSMQSKRRFDRADKADHADRWRQGQRFHI